MLRVTKNFQPDLVFSVQENALLRIWKKMSQKIKFEQWQLECFNDKNLMTVFLSLTIQPKTVKMISEETGISRTTVYRKIQKLKEKKLVAISGRITEDGIRHFLYSKQSL